MIGDPDVSSVKRWASGFGTYQVFLSFVSSQLPTGSCYMYLKEVFCRIVFPQCDEVVNQVIHICKETISDIADACMRHGMLIMQVLPSHLSMKRFKKFHRDVKSILSDVYLPSVRDLIPCFYRPVTCDPPPNTTNARIINASQLNGTYLAKFQVEYECVHETFQMEGNSTVTCLYSGQWSKLPKCLKRKRDKSIDP